MNNLNYKAVLIAFVLGMVFSVLIDIVKPRNIWLNYKDVTVYSKYDCVAWRIPPEAIRDSVAKYGAVLTFKDEFRHIYINFPE